MRSATGAARPSSGPTGVAAIDGVLAEALGRGHRRDPVLSGTGGPAGNARFTSWAGLALLVLIIAELVTLLDVSGLIAWHVGVGIALVAFAVVKTASTGWRIARYYGGAAAYRRAGPPPMVLRALGPAVIGCTLGVLGSGLALIALGPRASRRPWFAALGQQVSPLTVHQLLFILFAVVCGLHLCARLLPALTLARGGRNSDEAVEVPGRRARTIALAATAAAAVLAALLVLPSVHGW